MNRATSENFRRRLKSLIAITIGGSLTFAGIAVYKGNDRFYSSVILPLVHRMDAESAHRLAVLTAKYGLVPRRKPPNSTALKTTVWGIEFPNPIGMAAGFDKGGEAVASIFQLGFGFTEVGSVTPEPQSGNPLPRVFRLIEDCAVINRYGFNSEGHEVVHSRLQKFRSKDDRRIAKGILGVNLGKNKTSTDASDDYTRGVHRFSDVADFLVINLSSPNTPGLRSLQRKQQLEELIGKVLEDWKSLPKTRRRPLLIKIAPDLSTQERKDIAQIIMNNKEIAGLVVSNTTTSRPVGLKSAYKNEEGGLSGEPIKDLATFTIREMYSLTLGKVPIIGVGGISTGRDAYEKIRAGASLVELYTSMVFKGPTVAIQVEEELAELLRKDGFDSVAAAVGVDVPITKSKKDAT